MIYFNSTKTSPSEAPTIAPTKPKTPSHDPSKVKIPKPSVQPGPKAIL